MLRGVIAGLVALVLLFSCGDAGRGVSDGVSDTDSLYADSINLLAEDDSLELFEEEVLPKSADELFNDFFFNYVSNKDFQKQRTKRSLRIAKADSLSVDSSDRVGVAFKDLVVEDYYTIIYEREEELAFQKDTSLAEVVVERINLDFGVLESMCFKKYDGIWIMCDVQTSLVANTPNADFLSFYSVFSADSVGRVDNVADPLKLVMTADADVDEDEEEVLSVDEWMELSSEFPLPSHEIINVNYGQTYISNNNKFLLVEGVSNGLFLKYRFMKSGGRWMLVEVVV